MAPQRREKDWEGSLVSGCLPTKQSLLGTGGLYEDVGEKALWGRVPMEGLIPRLRFCVGGCCCTGGLFVVLPEVYVLCCTGGLLGVLFCAEVRGYTPELSFIKGFFP